MLLQSSIIEYLRMIVSVQPTTFGAESETKATVGVEQLSEAETNAIFGIGKVELQPETFKSDKAIAVGSVVSNVRIKF